MGPVSGLERPEVDFDQFSDEFGHLTPDALGLRVIKQASNPANPLPGIQSFRIDLLKHLARARHERFGAV